MKKIYIDIVQRLLLVLFMASAFSCTNEWQEEEVVQVSFTAALPAAARSRSFGSGSGIDRLVVGVYDENLNQILTQYEPVYGLDVDIQLTLAKNKTFHLIFWAYNSQADVYNLNDLSAISMQRTHYASWEEAEQADAFYGIQKNFMANNYNRNTRISMSRPLAQINIGITGNPVPASFRVPQLCNTFYPLDETVYGEATTYSWSFETPTEETFEVENTTYQYLGVGYVFAPIDEPMEASLKLINEETEVTMEFPTIKLQANHKCNIAGSFSKE